MRTFLRGVILGCALAVSGAAVTASAQSSGVGMGMWKLNPAKSTFNPGPPPSNFTTRFEPAGKGVKVTMEGRGPDGKAIVSGYTANYDRKEVPLTGSAVADTTSLRRIDAHTTERIDRKAGKVVQTLVRIVAKNGKSFTVTVKGIDEKGEKVDHVAVFDKQ